MKNMLIVFNRRLQAILRKKLRVYTYIHKRGPINLLFVVKHIIAAFIYSPHTLWKDFFALLILTPRRYV